MGIVHSLRFLMADLPHSNYETVGTTFNADLVRSNISVSLSGIMMVFVHISASCCPHEIFRDTLRAHASPSPMETGPAGTMAKNARDTVRVVARKRLNTLQRNGRSQQR